MADKLQTILDLIYQHPNQSRFNCPFCNRQNSLSIQTIDGMLRWRCFGNDCKNRGIQKQRITLDEISNIRHRLFSSNGMDNDSINNTFRFPDYFVSPLDRPEVLEYLRKNHVLSSYEHNRVSLKFDPKQNRVVFLISDSYGNICGAVGRSFNKSIIPKWLVYGTSKYPFVCGSKDVAIIVEDAASACAVSHLMTGIAILGTDFSNEYLSILKRYKHVIIGLDRDAVRKAMEIEASIRFFAETSVVMLEDDLKVLDEQHLKEFLGSHYDLSSIGELNG